MALIKKERIKESKEPFIIEPKKISGQESTLDIQKIKKEEKEDIPLPPIVEQIVTKSDEEIKSKALEEAEKILEQARFEAKNIFELSKKNGFEEGKKQGLAETGEYVKEALETLNQAIVEKNKIIKTAEPEILKLAIKIAEQIIRSEVSLNRDVCLSIVSEAISKVTDREQVIIRVNQSNLDQVRSQRERLATLLDGVKNLTIQEDPQVEPGGCIVETNLGFVDARISTKLMAIEEALKRVFKEETEENKKDEELDDKRSENSEGREF